MKRRKQPKLLQVRGWERPTPTLLTGDVVRLSHRPGHQYLICSTRPLRAARLVREFADGYRSWGVPVDITPDSVVAFVPRVA